MTAGHTAQPAELAITPARQVRRIQPSRGAAIDFRELWQYRELLHLLVWRDVRTRYKQTYLGGFWALFRPFAQMVLFSAVFGGLAKIKPGGGLPYPLFVYPGVIIWTYFSAALPAASSSILSSGGLLSKVYFPRLYAPLEAVAAPVVDWLLSLSILFGLFAWYERAPNWRVFCLPCFLLLALLIAFAMGLCLAGATVRYRDVPFALPFVAQIWMYATPVIYPMSLVPARYRLLIELNPMTAVVEGFRWSLLGGNPPTAVMLAASLGELALLLLVGIFIFRRAERTFMDVV